jgi:hypothetical protein
MRAIPPFDIRRAVRQTTFYDPHDVHAGNCTEAAIASILQLPLSAVTPLDRTNGRTFWDAVEAFFCLHGWDFITIPADKIPEGVHLASGLSARGRPHTVVYVGAQLVWDPHPSDAGIITIDARHILVPL